MHKLHFRAAQAFDRHPVQVRCRLNRSTHYGMIRSRSKPGDLRGRQQANRSNSVQTAASIFVNGITGVFIGMAVLYLAMKLIALLSTMGAGPEKSE